MGNEIKVNEFIRTKYGEIAKVIEYKDEIVLDKEIKFYGMYRGYICEDEIDFIVKHSPNLIDLIKAEDTIKIKIGLYTSFVHFIVDEDDLISIRTQIEANFWILDEIYTKEMMESISYKLTKM